MPVTQVFGFFFVALGCIFDPNPILCVGSILRVCECIYLCIQVPPRLKSGYKTTYIYIYIYIYIYDINLFHKTHSKLSDYPVVDKYLNNITKGLIF